MAKVEIVIDAVDKATDDIKKIQGGLDSMGRTAKGTGGSFTEFNSVLSIATKGIELVGQAYKSTIEPMIAYGEQVDRLSRLSGMSAEETSRMIQVTDDLFISYESLTTALQAAVRKGVDPSIKSLKKMSDEYLKLNPGLERSKYLMDNFGRSGAEMGKLLEQGSKHIDEMAASIDEGLIFDENKIKDIMAYKQAVDSLTDAWTALKQKALMPIIPYLSIAIEEMAKGHGPAQILARILSGDLPTAANQTGDAMNYAADETDGLTAAMDAQQSKLDMVSSSFKELTAETLYNKAAQGLDANAALYLARGMGLLNEKTYAQLQQLQILRTSYDANADGLISADEGARQYALSIMALNGATEETTSVYMPEFQGILRQSKDDLQDVGRDVSYNTLQLQRMGNAIRNIPEKKTITITTNYVETYSGTRSSQNNLAGRHYATGGFIPGGQPSIVGERGPELFIPSSSGTIIPNNKMGQTIVFNYSPTVSLASEAEAQQKLLPYIREALRAA